MGGVEVRRGKGRSGGEGREGEEWREGKSEERGKGRVRREEWKGNGMEKYVKRGEWRRREV